MVIGQDIEKPTKMQIAKGSNGKFGVFLVFGDKLLSDQLPEYVACTQEEVEAFAEKYLGESGLTIEHINCSPLV